MAAVASLPSSRPDSPLPTTSDQERFAAWVQAQEHKELLRFVTIGSVDDGKSTLIGRLLHDAQGLYQDQLDAVRRASVKGATRAGSSTAEIDFSLFTDGLVAEREQGITIDVAYRYFATDRRKFIIADTPGHVQYTRNMATGASTAGAAVILIDARLGVIEQTRRHAHIAALLGIPHVLACVNKMDLVDFAPARFDEIAQQLETLRAEVGLRALEPIPVSALAGDNVVTRSERTPWYAGETLLERLETLPVAGDGLGYVGAFRLPVQLVIRPGLAYRGFAGQIASGAVAVGDTVVALPSGRTTTVVGIDVGDRAVTSAAAPSSVSLRLADEIDISRGDVLAKPGEEPTIAADIEASLVWMSERPLERGRLYLVKHTTRTVRAELFAPHALALNDIARVTIRARAPLYFDAYEENRTTGAFIVIDALTNDTVAAGMIVGAATQPAIASNVVTEESRQERLGQRGLVARVRANEAHDLERALFAEGRIAAITTKDHAEALARAGLIALVPDGDATTSSDLASILRDSAL